MTLSRAVRGTRVLSRLVLGVMGAASPLSAAFALARLPLWAMRTHVPVVSR